MHSVDGTISVVVVGLVATHGLMALDGSIEATNAPVIGEMAESRESG